MRKYIDLVEIFPYPISTPRYVISKTKLTTDALELIEQFWHPKRFEKYKSSFVIDKDYIILFDKINNNVMMSTHEFEMISNQKFLDNAKGDVLIFGLGIGLILHPIFTDKDINSIKIVEVDEGLIEEIYPIIKEYDVKLKLSIVKSDAFNYQTEEMFDTIYFDIWSDINLESFIQMKTLSENFSKNLKPGGWMDSWCSEEEIYGFK